MSTYSEILVDRVGTDGRVARVTLNRPGKLNVLDDTMVGELVEALHELESDRTARVIILRGAGRAFCAGWDIADPSTNPVYSGGTFAIAEDDGRPLAMNVASMLKRGAEAQLYMWGMAKVTVAQLHGYCIAGGFEWAMMADLVTASSDCVIGHPGSRGLGVGRNASMLPLMTNYRKAKELVLTGDSVTGDQAFELGIVNYAWAGEELEDRTIALADRVANMSADHLAVTKAAANRLAENMGVRAAVISGSELDALGQNTEANHTWTDLLKSGGLKAALEWRDKPYGDYGYRPR